MFSYWPVLQPSTKRVAAYRLSSKVMLENSLWNVEDLPEDLHGSTIAALDQLVLRRAIVDLVDCVHKELVNVIIIPVNFSTLNTGSYRKSYLEICASVPKHFQRYLAWEITNSGVQSWHSQLLNAVSAVKRYGSMVGIDVDLNLPDFTDLKALGVNVVGYHCENVQLQDEAHYSKLKQFKKRAELEGLRTYVFGIPSKQVFEISVATGVEYINGAYIDLSVEHPVGIYSYEKEIPGLAKDT